MKNNMLDVTGISKQTANEVSEKLNGLLADMHVFYINLRGLHWNIKGRRFLMLHAKFEELYDETAENIDEVAERILQLDNTPLHSLKDFADKATLEEVKNVADADKALQAVLDGYKTLIAKERELLALTDEHNDETTNAMMSDLIGGQEKTVWMLVSAKAN